MMDRKAILDRYFLDCRCILLELAATLDRHDRAAPDPSRARSGDDRLSLFQQAVQVLAQPSARPDRAERMLRLFSDPVA